MMTQAERKATEEKKNDLITRSEEILAKAKVEERELTEDEAMELAEIRDDVKAIKAKILGDDAEKDLEDMKEKETTTEEEKTVEETRALETKEIEVREREQFENFIRGMIVHERAGELTPETSGSGIGLGGSLIPTTIVNYIIRKVYDICPVLERSQKFNVKGKLDIPFYPADAQNITVGYQSEFSPIASSSGSFDTVELGGFLAGALTKISESLINNVEIDIVQFVVDEMAQQIARFIEGELLNGTTNKVAGLSTLSNGITTASASAITADEVVKLHDCVKDIFQQNAIWIMNPETRTALRLLKDSMGRYLLNDDISTPFGTSLLGKPVFVSDNMPKIATGNKTIFYGDMKGLATKFSEDINVKVLRERYADEHAVGVVSWFEFDAKVIDEQQIAVMTMA